MFKISTMNWFFNNFNKFENNFLIFKVILSSNNVKHVIKTLKNIDVSDYSFIDQDIAHIICDKLKFVLVSLFKFKHFVCFDDRMIKFVIHAIYFTFIVKNHNEFICFMFVIHIKNHSLILKKLWINRHNVIFDFKNDFIRFKFERCFHWDFSRNDKQIQKKIENLWLSDFFMNLSKNLLNSKSFIYRS